MKHYDFKKTSVKRETSYTFSIIDVKRQTLVNKIIYSVKRETLFNQTSDRYKNVRKMFAKKM
mgnify:CR=1